VNRAVNQMDQVTQQNAAMVGESTTASQAVAHEASDLARLVGRFRIDAEPSAAPERSDARGRMAELQRAVGGGLNIRAKAQGEHY
jgi:methyl-accepting chemotaxis protein